MAPTSDQSIRILLVDDEEDLVEFLAHRLLKHGCTVAATTSGAEALKAIASQIFDVAILDLKMPEIDGIELLERIRSVQPFLMNIMLTGYGSMESALAAGRLKAFRYLIKPFDTDELLKLIREAHSQREELLETAFQAEMAEVISPSHTPQEILARGDELRRKYERA